MELCGLDISKRRVGVSLAHVYFDHNNKYILNKIIIPYKVIDLTANHHSFTQLIGELKKRYNNIRFIIGLPNRRYENFVKVKHFTHKYRDLLQPFVFQDEEFSTLIIENDMDKRLKKHNDDLAASVILENFLKNKNYEQLNKM